MAGERPPNHVDARPLGTAAFPTATRSSGRANRALIARLIAQVARPEERRRAPHRSSAQATKARWRLDVICEWLAWVVHHNLSFPLLDRIRQDLAERVRPRLPARGRSRPLRSANTSTGGAPSPAGSYTDQTCQSSRRREPERER